MRLFRILVPLLTFLQIFSPILADNDERKIRVALFHDTGSHPRGNLRKAIEAAPDMTLTLLHGIDIREGALDQFDLLILPGGSARRQSMTLEARGRDEIRRFVANGGLYIGICAGCYLLTSSKESDLGLLPLGVRDRNHWARGKATLPVELTPMGQEIFGTKQKIWKIFYHNGPVVNTSDVLPENHFSILGTFQAEIVNKRGIKDIMIGSPAMFLGRFGKGLVLGISPHPEANRDQVFMEVNAIRWMYAHRTRTLKPSE